MKTRFLVSILLLSVTLINCATTNETDELSLNEDGTGESSEPADESDFAEKAAAGAPKSNSENLSFNEDQPATAKRLPPPIRGDKSPFPKSFNLFEFAKYMQLNKGLYVRYLPLEREYDLYYKTVNQSSEVDDEARLTIKDRIKENDEKAHWVFMHGINELLHFMHENSRRMLRADLEDNFASRMKTISEIAIAFRDTKKNTRYLDFARSLYISINDRYFGREVKLRQKD